MAEQFGERIDQPAPASTATERLLFARHHFAYGEVAPRLKDSKTLEIGCGNAYGTALLRTSARSIIALDVDHALIERLKKSQPVQGETQPLSFMVYEGERLPFEAGSFDHVVSFQVLEHVDDDQLFLGEILRVLKPGGTAFLTTPNRLLRLLPQQRPFNPYHVREYTPEQLRTLALATGGEWSLKGVFGDAPTQFAELSRLRKYKTWRFRHLFQPLPESVKEGIKNIVLKIGHIVPLPSNKNSMDFKFVLKSEPLEDAIDLWLELKRR